MAAALRINEPAPSAQLALGNGKTLEMRSCPAVWRRDGDGSKRTNCRSSIEGLRRPGRIESGFPGGRVRWGNAPGPPWLRRQKRVVPQTDGVETIGVGRGPLQASSRDDMNHYVGVDVSLEASSVCVVDGNRKIVCEPEIASEPNALSASIRGGVAQSVDRILVN
jgi:hypothetical protein